MADPGADHARRVVGYYRSPESRLAYRLLLGGTKHFGYYPEGSGRLSMAAAMRRMEDKLGQTLALPPASRVLDAGCGEGDVAIRLHTRFGLEVDGVLALQRRARPAALVAASPGDAG
jgi:sterol 24-C-methyltransferase